MRGRKRNADIPIEDTQVVVTAYLKEGKSLKEIAKPYGATVYVLTMFLRDNGVEIKSRGRRLGSKNVVVELYNPLGKMVLGGRYGS